MLYLTTVEVFLEGKVTVNLFYCTDNKMWLTLNGKNVYFWNVEKGIVHPNIKML